MSEYGLLVSVALWRVWPYGKNSGGEKLSCHTYCLPYQLPPLPPYAHAHHALPHCAAFNCAVTRIFSKCMHSLLGIFQVVYAMHLKSSKPALSSLGVCVFELAYVKQMSSSKHTLCHYPPGSGSFSGIAVCVGHPQLCKTPPRVSYFYRLSAVGISTCLELYYRLCVHTTPVVVHHHVQFSSPPLYSSSSTSSRAIAVATS